MKMYLLQYWVRTRLLIKIVPLKFPRDRWTGLLIYFGGDNIFYVVSVGWTYIHSNRRFSKTNWFKGWFYFESKCTFIAVYLRKLLYYHEWDLYMLTFGVGCTSIPLICGGCSWCNGGTGKASGGIPITPGINGARRPGWCIMPTAANSEVSFKYMATCRRIVELRGPRSCCTAKRNKT